MASKREIEWGRNVVISRRAPGGAWSKWRICKQGLQRLSDGVGHSMWPLRAHRADDPAGGPPRRVGALPIDYLDSILWEEDTIAVAGGLREMGGIGVAEDVPAHPSCESDDTPRRGQCPRSLRRHFGRTKFPARGVDDLACRHAHAGH